MPRKKGSQNADFEATRRDLLRLLRTALLCDKPPSSLRGLAQAAHVTVPTLRHYFGDREGVFEAVFADFHAGGRRELDTAGKATGAFRSSIHKLVRHVADGFIHGGLDRLHSTGLVEGLANRRVAGAYLAEILEPTIAAVQARLVTHMERGEMKPVDTRHAALGLVSPILVLFLHQQALGGAAGYPIDIDLFIAGHVEAFVAGYKE